MGMQPQPPLHLPQRARREARSDKPGGLADRAARARPPCHWPRCTRSRAASDRASGSAPARLDPGRAQASPLVRPRTAPVPRAWGQALAARGARAPEAPPSRAPLPPCRAGSPAQHQNRVARKERWASEGTHGERGARWARRSSPQRGVHGRDLRGSSGQKQRGQREPHARQLGISPAACAAARKLERGYSVAPTREAAGQVVSSVLHMSETESKKNDFVFRRLAAALCQPKSR